MLRSNSKVELTGNELLVNYKYSKIKQTNRFNSLQLSMFIVMTVLTICWGQRIKRNIFFKKTFKDRNKRKKLYTTFRLLYAIILKCTENETDNLIYTMRGARERKSVNVYIQMMTDLNR